MEKMGCHDDKCQKRTAIWRLNCRPAIRYGSRTVGMFKEIKNIQRNVKNKETLKNVPSKY